VEEAVAHTTDQAEVALVAQVVAVQELRVIKVQAVQVQQILAEVVVDQEMQQVQAVALEQLLLNTSFNRK
jgi:hypothetical protein